MAVNEPQKCRVQLSRMLWSYQDSSLSQLTKLSHERGKCLNTNIVNIENRYVQPLEILVSIANSLLIRWKPQALGFILLTRSDVKPLSWWPKESTEQKGCKVSPLFRYSAYTNVMPKLRTKRQCSMSGDSLAVENFHLTISKNGCHGKIQALAARAILFVTAWSRQDSGQLNKQNHFWTSTKTLLFTCINNVNGTTVFLFSSLAGTQ